MKCNRKKPEACFTCTFPDCMDTSWETTTGEKEFLSMVINDTKPKINRSPESKRKQREYIREWNRKHQKEQTEKRRLYQHNYYLQRKAARQNV